jgi:hypothetical protein
LSFGILHIFQQDAGELLFQKLISFKAAGDSVDGSVDLTFDLDLRDPISLKIPDRDVTGLVNSCFSHFGCSPFSHISGQKEPGHIETHR